MVVRASAEESRRSVLGGMLAGVVALTAGGARANDLEDRRSARANGFDIIYEARDLALPQVRSRGRGRGERAAADGLTAV